MFIFSEFYNGLFKRTDYFDNYWDKFPTGRLLRFKNETLALLQENVNNRDTVGLANILAVIYHDGADSDFTYVLTSILNMNWHNSEEDIVSVLELIKDPRSINALYSRANNIPDYDDMRGLAKKCMSALREINTNESFEKLKLLQRSSDPIIQEYATFNLKNFQNK